MAQDTSGRVAVKYHTTARILTDFLGKECVEWARMAAKEMGQVT
jgi:hypothetical protein